MAAYAFDEDGARRISDFVRRSERGLLAGSRRRRQVPVTRGGGEVTVNPCGCGPCVDSGLMTIDIGTDWDAASSYVVGGIELEHVSGTTWESDVFTGACPDVFWRLTVSGQSPGDVVLEMIDDSSSDVISRYENSIMYWIPYCPHTLFLVTADLTVCEFDPGCFGCLGLDASLLE